MKKIGFLINPVAGLGGQAGMKGSDGERSREQALSLGYQKTALRRASAAIGQIRGGADHRADTIAYARAMGAKGVELLVFCGGDGTARDIYEAVGSQFPVLGIPAGVKMYSACYAVNPWQARELLRDFIWGRKLSFVPREVMDMDEAYLSEAEVSPALYGFLTVPGDGVRLQRAMDGDGP